MEKVQAYLNHGRWLVDCPKHGRNGTLEVQVTDTEYIAPCCYPGVIAQFTGMVKNRVQSVPDISARATAHARARTDGEVYEIAFPENMNEIMDALRGQPVTMQNWVSGDSIEFLLSDEPKSEVF